MECVSDVGGRRVVIFITEAGAKDLECPTLNR